MTVVPGRVPSSESELLSWIAPDRVADSAACVSCRVDGVPLYRCLCLKKACGAFERAVCVGCIVRHNYSNTQRRVSAVLGRLAPPPNQKDIDA